MVKTEYALIAALYDTKGADLYKDIYFPIVQYAVVSMFYSSYKDDKYFSLSDLKDTIRTMFGIEIPLVVLQQCVRVLEKRRDGIELKYYKDGQTFLIRSAWDITINSQIDGQAQEIRLRFEQLDNMFQRFLELEQLESDRNFIDFFSDYAEDIVSFIDNRDTIIRIDENYSNLSRFISWIKKNEAVLYETLNDIFWGAIIAGFLSRSKADLGIKIAENTLYYIDSSLILALLDLDSPENVSYARELMQIIKDAGSVPHIHALTMREIHRIFSQIETNGEPRPGTAISDAFMRRKLKLSDLLHIRNNLSTILDRQYGVVPDMMGDRELDDIESRMKLNSEVIALSKEYMSSSPDNIREIHDIYVCRDVIKKNRDRSSIEKLDRFFVTRNVSLVEHFSTPKPSPIMHAGNVAMNLWLHSAKSSMLKKSVLIEAVSRSFALNQTNVRQKLNMFISYFKDTDISDDQAKGMYTALIRRSKKTIIEIDELLEQDDELSREDYARRKQRAEALVRASYSDYENRQQSLSSELRRNEAITNELTELKAQIQAVQSQQNVDKDTITMLQDTLTGKDKSINSQQAEIDRLKIIIKRNNRKHEIEMEQTQIRQDLLQLEEERHKSVFQVKFWVNISIEVFILLSLVSLAVVYFFMPSVWESLKDMFNIAVLLAIIGLVWKLGDAYILTPKSKRQQIRNEQLRSWDDAHPSYRQKLQRKEELEAELSNLSTI